MRIGILQPGYLPWMGFFEQLYRCDIFVIYDDVQYDKHGWRNRNRIKTPQGAQWLTVPVLTKGKNKPMTGDVLIDNNEAWAKKHLRTIEQNYGKAPFFAAIFPICEEILSGAWTKLIDLNMNFIYAFMEFLNVKREIVFSSSLEIEGSRIQKLINICRHFGADTFYEGASGKNYIEEKSFLDAGIKVSYQEYRHPVYQQLYGDFISHLSIVDLLFNHGKDSLSILSDNQLITSR